jgi:hypothetical protein
VIRDLTNLYLCIIWNTGIMIITFKIYDFIYKLVYDNINNISEIIKEQSEVNIKNTSTVIILINWKQCNYLRWPSFEPSITYAVLECMTKRWKILHFNKKDIIIQRTPCKQPEEQQYHMLRID